MSSRRQASNATVKAWQTRRQDAYRRDAVRVVRRRSVRRDLLTQTAAVTGRCEHWGLSPSCLYDWQKACLVRGRDSLLSRHSGGRPETLTPRQKKRVGEWREAGPLAVGCETAWWNAVVIRVLIWRECGVLSHGHEGGTLLHTVGCSFPKARFVAAHLDADKRRAWLQDKWPAILRAAKRGKGWILCEDEARGAPWGAVRYTWARRGRQPAVPTRGKRTGDKVFGAIDSCSGRLVSPGIAGRWNSESSQAFLQRIMAQTTEHLLVIPDGARSHPSASTKAFVAAPRDRLTAHPFPSYAPDDHPMAYLGNKTKQRATPNKYFNEFAALTVSVDKALTSFAMQPETVFGLCGRSGEESSLELEQAA